MHCDWPKCLNPTNRTADLALKCDEHFTIFGAYEIADGDAKERRGVGGLPAKTKPIEIKWISKFKMPYFY